MNSYTMQLFFVLLLVSKTLCAGHIERYDEERDKGAVIALLQQTKSGINPAAICQGKIKNGTRTCDRIMYIFREGQQVIGFAQWHKQSKRITLQYVAVSPRYHGKGICEQLMTYNIQDSRLRTSDYL